MSPDDEVALPHTLGMSPGEDEPPVLIVEDMAESASSAGA
jgi:hypothetical protein